MLESVDSLALRDGQQRSDHEAFQKLTSHRIFGRKEFLHRPLSFAGPGEAFPGGDLG